MREFYWFLIGLLSFLVYFYLSMAHVSAMLTWPLLTVEAISIIKLLSVREG